VIAGSVTINSTNPLDPPLINPNLLQSTFDFLAIREALLATRRFASAPAWKGYLLSEVANITDDNLDDHIRNSTTVLLHPVSTARMSRKGEEWGVVDPDLRVKGVEGLRIVDASVFVSISLITADGIMNAEEL
jgi:choline dehydrogenase-like flavoprotein